MEIKPSFPLDASALKNIEATTEASSATKSETISDSASSKDSLEVAEQKNSFLEQLESRPINFAISKPFIDSSLSVQGLEIEIQVVQEKLDKTERYYEKFKEYLSVALGALGPDEENTLTSPLLTGSSNELNSNEETVFGLLVDRLGVSPDDATSLANAIGKGGEVGIAVALLVASALSGNSEINLHHLADLAQQYLDTTTAFNQPDPTSPAAQAIVGSVSQAFPDGTISFSPSDFFVFAQAAQTDLGRAGNFLDQKFDVALQQDKDKLQDLNQRLTQAK